MKTYQHHLRLQQFSNDELFGLPSYVTRRLFSHVLHKQRSTVGQQQLEREESDNKCHVSSLYCMTEKEAITLLDHGKKQMHGQSVNHVNLLKRKPICCIESSTVQDVSCDQNASSAILGCLGNGKCCLTQGKQHPSL